MHVSSYVLAIDEGGTGVRAYLFDHEGRVAGSAYQEIAFACPRPGWLEHDAAVLWSRTLAVVEAALRAARGGPREVCGIGITNQRSSAVVWDAETGEAIYPVIGWQDLRTTEQCAELNRRGYPLFPLQSATKFAWIVDNVPGARARADAGGLRFGTVDVWLSWRLSGGSVYVTDASNASCTGLYDFFGNGWDETLLELLHLPAGCLPAIVPTGAVAGETRAALVGSPLPLAARAGDQQAAMFGQLRIEPGMAKITYGTAAMMDLNVGPALRLSAHGAFPLVLWQRDDAVTYCLEGTVVTAGAAIQWLCEGLGIIRDPSESGELASGLADSGGVWCVPAFQGLGTPYLDASARALIGGLSRGTGRAHVARAVLEGVAFRCGEILAALQADGFATALDTLRVDGGAARNDFLMQCQADVTGIPVERAAILDAASLGAAYLAGLATGFWADLDDVARTWRRERLFEPHTTPEERSERAARWRSIVELARRVP